MFQPQTTGCCHASTLNHPAMFSSFYKKAERLILVILDLSGSMNAYKKHVHASCLELEKFYGDGKTGSAVYFISFAGLGEMASSERVNDVMHINGGTSIAQAFQSAINVINVKHIRMNFKKVSLVFVSDGEDNQPDQCRRAIAALQGKLPHGVECEIHCIGCFGFPTDFAAGPLFAIFGKSNRRTVAPVLACPEPIEFPHVFSVLRKMLESSEDPPVPTAEDLASLADPQAMVEVARRVYNAAVNASMYFKDTPELQAFEDCVEKLGRVQAMHKTYVRQTKTSPASALFSNSIRQAETKSNGLVLENLYRQAKKCLDMVKTGQKISHLSDQAKLDIAGMAGNLKMLKKVSKYHMPDEARVIASLVGFLEEYPTDPALPPARYDGLVETEEKVSLYEVFADAKSVLTSITGEKLSAEELLAHLPLIGYSLKIAKLPSGASMNPWLVHVEGMSFSPSTMQELLSDPGAYNGMLLVPSQVPHKDATWFKYCQSCILYTDFEAASQFNSAIFQNEAWWALLAACVKHWLLEPSLWNSVAFGPTQLSICDGFRSLFTCVHPHATGYIELMKNDFQFRDCLVAEHPSLGKFLTCPHLTKPLFAMWYYMSSLNDPEKVPFDDRKFRRRYIGFLVEFFHRAGVQRIKWTDLVCVKPVKEILDEEIGGLIDKCYEHGCTLPKALHALWPSVRASLDAVRLKVKENPGNYVELPRINLEALDDLENHHFTFGSIVSAFIGLAGCLRYGLESGSDGETIVKLTELELARILLVAQNRDNLLRNRDPLFDTPLSLVISLSYAFSPSVILTLLVDPRRRNSRTWPTSTESTATWISSTPKPTCALSSATARSSARTTSPPRLASTSERSRRGRPIAATTRRRTSTWIPTLGSRATCALALRAFIT